MFFAGDGNQQQGRENTEPLPNPWAPPSQRSPGSSTTSTTSSTSATTTGTTSTGTGGNMFGGMLVVLKIIE